ncbi:MAG: hypothetical protein A3B30_04375 [Candidatus Komeilibacteria bacterium RIFCSPLOWO2_01_FULL_52_15]|uniref:Methyltransferase type 11 domain-containing protein n=2 Tax=Candidatus Komeiliibacteriota TaxID=1817908 RepID=A0A1G2BSA2_9BACT|nr:MAG: hypothetical protein A2677_04135 [Candidatus Komeilibacteria bacterium RIFCSPHIGHO2_01_FULL_52_14]OGY91117.1 MAG: hypothetical protein A3B30_04375 [Candidatus Komeilibacteria bacterium RIFCSPLOWO2_01_FULL_52_15]
MKHGVADFRLNGKDEVTESFDIRIRNFFKRWPRAYYFIATIFGPLMFTGISPKKFATRYCTPDLLSVNIGSGPRPLVAGILNLDIVPYKGVSVIADTVRTPFATNSVDVVVCNEVIEHVERPEELAREIARIVTPGGSVYLTMPFLYPFHASPSDFSRWTEPGVALLFSDFTVREKGVRAGPFSALTVLCCYLFATVFSFNSKQLFWILMNVSLFIFFPIKIFDLIVFRFSTAPYAAALTYYVLQKK